MDQDHLRSTKSLFLIIAYVLVVLLHNLGCWEKFSLVSCTRWCILSHKPPPEHCSLRNGMNELSVFAAAVTKVENNQGRWINPASWGYPIFSPDWFNPENLGDTKSCVSLIFSRRVIPGGTNPPPLSYFIFLPLWPIIPPKGSWTLLIGYPSVVILPWPVNKSRGTGLLQRRDNTSHIMPMWCQVYQIIWGWT